jgi:polysaccharide chain length determinant protein (PEP-CTERM system associated)
MQRQLTPADYIAMLRRRWVLITALTVVGGPLAYGYSRTLPDRYQSKTLVLVEQPTIPAEIVRPVISSGLSQRLSSMQQQILSRTRLEPMIRQFGLYAADANRVPIEELVGRLQKTIEVTPIQPMAETRSQDLPGFYVSVTLDNPRTAQAVCTAITSMFIEENLRLRQQDSEDTTQFLAQQLADAKGKLDEQDAALAAFKSRYLGSLPDEEQTNLNLLMGMTTQLDAATQALARAQQDKSFAESMLSQQIAAWQASQTGHNPQTFEQQLIALQTQLASLQARYTDDYPDVIKVKNDIAALKKRMAESDAPPMTEDAQNSAHAAEPQQIQVLRSQIHQQEQVISEKAREQGQIQRQIKVYQERVQSSPAVEQQYKELTRGYQTALDSYNDLQKKRDQSAIATNLERRQQGEQFRVLDPANLPNKPTFPDRRLFAMGGFGGGLALGLGIAFLLELKDTSLRSERDVEAILRVPMLVMIPEIEPLSSKGVQPATQGPPSPEAVVGTRG